MIRTIAAILLVLCVAAAQARAGVIRELTWDKSLPTAATTQQANAVTVTAPANGGTIVVLALDQPGASDDAFAIEGQIKYENVTPPGHLELTGVFADGSRETSKAAAPFGPMGALNGSSDWRAFLLPSLGRRVGEAPTRIEVSVVLPGGGTVYLGPAKLVEGLANRRPREMGWLDPPRVRMLAGALGALVALYGVIASILASRGRGKGLVYGLTVVVTALSCAALGCSVTAMVWNAAHGALALLALVGLMGIALCAVMSKLVKRKYARNTSGTSVPA